MTKNKRRLISSDALISFSSSIMSILIGFVIGILVMVICSFLISSANLGNGIAQLFMGPFSALKPLKEFGNMLFYAVPLIFTGLSVGIAYKTGLFNIGAPGQFLVGTAASLYIALSIDSTGKPVQGVLIWILAVLAGALAGMIWGAIPGILKATLGINEVIICIMTNWIAANSFTWFFSTQHNLINKTSGKSGYLIKTAVTGNGTPSLFLKEFTQNSYLDISIFIAIAIAIVLWFVMRKTTFGYSLRACGLNHFCAKYAGINEKKYIILSMMIAGGLAGLGGCFYYLNPGIEVQFLSAYQNLPSYGFDGIPVALLANCNPIGIIFSAIFMRYISASGSFLSISGFNRYFADIIVAVIVYLSGFSRFFLETFSGASKKRNDKKSAYLLHVLTIDLLPEKQTENKEGGK